jgi:D-proline reductase (dithiol) PrdB
VLAHVFESAGIATVAFSSVREMTMKTAPPRALHCEFPLGRPLGKPGDVEFQHDVLAHALALLGAPRGPLLVDYPVTIEATAEQIECRLPPRFYSDRPPAIDEATGIRNAYDRVLRRRGVTSVGRVIGADAVPDALARLIAIADGADWRSVGLPGGNTTALCHDIRTYYEEAALDLLTETTPGPRAIEDWFFEQTEAGRVLLAARAAMREAGEKTAVWFYMAPGHR